MGEHGTAESGYAIEVHQLRKSFGDRHALKGMDLRVRNGETLAVFGPNGAGKTTLVRILATIARPSDGKVRLAGLDVRKDAVTARRAIGVVSHQTYLYDGLTAYENLQFYGKMYDVPNLDDRILEVADRVYLRHRLHDRVGTLSRGMQQRFSIARAILHEPSILLLDEPETGLDPQATSMLHRLVRSLASDKRTLLITTHHLDLGLDLADRVIVIHRGKIVLEALKDNLRLEDLQQSYYRFTGAGQ